MKALFRPDDKSRKSHVGIKVAGRARSNGVLSRRVALGTRTSQEHSWVSASILKKLSSDVVVLKQHYAYDLPLKRLAWAHVSGVASHDQVDEQF